jgi:hypothetical protein
MLRVPPVVLENEYLKLECGVLEINLINGLTWVLLSIGDDGLTGWCTNRLARGKGAETREGKISEELKSHCRIYFPSRESVEQSKGGTGVGENPFVSRLGLLILMIS